MCFILHFALKYSKSIEILFPFGILLHCLKALIVTLIMCLLQLQKIPNTQNTLCHSKTEYSKKYWKTEQLHPEKQFNLPQVVSV